ncbi:MAG: hypothetical protein GWO20_09865 [Candidatus Korarchaeota archaeon]|nr:hypothetical protein [Candidatus Korarchaeota archaeon]NIU85327.1 hypothetical protein [Candidatus Thorarchaeota archaeon]NIW13960.1 hypothetical protein [Candidatus Thorarchaeota archaeon]NIW52099.1 hypothetical protein [Candidatus Korarchaeota archaeon]
MRSKAVENDPKKNYHWFDARGKECLNWARKMEKENKIDAALSWYIRSYFAFMAGGEAKQGQRVMEEAIRIQDAESFTLSQCFFQLALAKLKLGVPPEKEIAKGKEILKRFFGDASISNPFLPLKKRYEGIASAFEVISLVWEERFEQARGEFEGNKKKIFTSWGWYGSEIKRLLSSLLRMTSVKEVLQAFVQSNSVG